MRYAQPFQFTPDPARPLLVAACSKVKREASGLVRFGDLYDGPTWRDIRASGFPMANVAAISALHGFMEPGTQIETYDRVMDDKISARICGTGNDVWRLGQMVQAHPETFVLGGALYQEIARTVARVWPNTTSRIVYASGSFLAQRKQLGEWLRAQCPAKEAA